MWIPAVRISYRQDQNLRFTGVVGCCECVRCVEEIEVAVPGCTKRSASIANNSKRKTSVPISLLPGAQKSFLRVSKKRSNMSNHRLMSADWIVTLILV